MGIGAISDVPRPPLDLRWTFAPRAIAVVGASPDPGRHNGRPVANLLRTGYTGAIYPVNPRYEEVDGLRCYATVTDLPGQIDLAYVMVRAELVERVVVDCAKHGVGTIVVCSSGFAEDGSEGALQQRRLRDAAWAHGARLLGPNCIGLISVPENVASCTTLNVTTSFTVGAVTVVSQSGGMATNLFNRMQGAGVGVRAMVSLGNEADLDLADLVGALADDPLSQVIMLYVEQVRDHERFRDAVARARAQGKRLVALKVGRSAASVRSARGHTGAMAGSYVVSRDLLTAMGVLVVESINDLVDLALALQSLEPPRGRRVLVVSPSGGECGYVADRAVDSGLELPDLSPGLRARLSEVMHFGIPGNPLDLTGQVIGDAELLHRVFGIIEDSAEVDAVVVALPTWGEFDSRRLMPSILSAAEGSSVPMLISAWQSAGLTEWRDGLLANAGAPSFADADRAVRALARLALLGELDTRPFPRLTLTGGPVEVPADAYIDEAGAMRFLSNRGFPVGDQRPVSTDDEAAQAAGKLGWPVVLKGRAVGADHKSDLGLVRVGIADPAALEMAMTEMRAASLSHGADLQGFLVARQHRGLEVILGAVPDPEFGRVILLGSGGTNAELLDDKAFLPCPTRAEDVRLALAGLRFGKLLSGHRGADFDVAALAHLVEDFSRLVANLAEPCQIDLNPVLVGSVADGGGVRIVDALVIPAN